MIALLSPRLWAALALAAALAFAAWWHTSQVKAARADGVVIGKAEVMREWDAERAALQAAADKANADNKSRKDAQDEAAHNAQTDRAQATQRQRALDAAAAADRERLRSALAIAVNTATSCSRDLSAAAADARAARGAAIAAVLADVERAGADMAAAADGHAADSLMYQRAWPK